MKNRIKIIIATTALLFSVACTKNLKKKVVTEFTDQITEASFERIKPVLDIAVGCQSDVFDVGKGAEINYSSGAKVKVPSNAFVDEDGNPVKGEVKLEFSEINDPASVIASGLPMCIEDNGSIGYLESGGMFEINAKQNGKKLKLAEGKSVEVLTMSDKPGDFNFYEYDATGGKWVEQNQETLSASSQPNPGNTTNSDIAIESKTSQFVKPIKATSDDFIFDLRVDNVSEWGMKNWEGIMWKFTDADEANDAHWLFSKKWRNISIGSFDPKTGSCLITASYKNRVTTQDPETGQTKVGSENKQKTTNVTPVLFGDGYKKAFEQYQRTVVAIQKKEKRDQQAQRLQEANGAFLRSVSINKMGVYNWDRIIKQPETMILTANYSVENLYDHEELPIIYMITGDQKGVITFYQGVSNNLAFNPTYPNTLLAIMPNKEIAVLKTDNIPDNKILSAKSNKKIDINLKPTGVFVQSTAQLNDFINENS